MGNITRSAPKSVITLLRVEALAALAGSLIVYSLLGGSWWLFALLLLVPDLSMLGMLLGDKAGVIVYNTAHTYLIPALLAASAHFGNQSWLLAIALIWTAHIAMDRTLGYGLKISSFRETHLGPIGKEKGADRNADAV